MPSTDRRYRLIDPRTGKPMRYVHHWVDLRNGTARFRFRRAGFKPVALPGLPGSPEFLAAYDAAMAGQTLPLPIGASRVKAGSLSAVIVSYLASAQFLALSQATRQTYRNILERFRREHGDKPVAGLSRKHIEAMLTTKVQTPAAANHWLRLVKALLDHAVAHGFRADNPAAAIKRIQHRAPGFHTWSEEEIAAFEARHAVGSKARLALALLLYTAQRRSDVVRMGRQHVKGGLLHITQQKTGNELAIPLHPALVEVMDNTPSKHLTFLVTDYGRPFTAAGFGNWFRDQCNAASLPKDCAAHGLRKAACRRLAEAGCSEKQIMSISGHTDIREVQRYTEAADKQRLSRSAMAAVVEAFGAKTGTSTGNGQ